MIRNALVKIFPDESQESYEIYEYATKILINQIFFSTIVFIYSFIVHQFFLTLFSYMLLILLRRLTGGLHFDNENACKALSAFIICAIPTLVQYEHYMDQYLGLLSIILGIYSFNYIPIESKNKKLTVKEKYLYRKIYTIFIVLIIFLSVFFYVNNLIVYLKIIFYTLIINSLLIILGKYANHFTNINIPL